MIIWPKVQIFQRYTHLTNKSKQNYEDLPNTIKTPSTVFDKTQPTCQKINKQSDHTQNSPQ